MNKELATTIGTAARVARRRLQLTQVDVAERMDLTTEFYGRIERGTSLPSIVTFARLVSALGVSADVLLGQAPSHQRNWAVEIQDEPEDRRLLRRIRKASEGALNLVNLLLRELEKPASDKNGAA